MTEKPGKAAAADEMGDGRVVMRVLNEAGIISQLASSELLRVLERGMGMSEFGVLNHFVRLGDIRTPSWLAKAFQMSRPSMTVIISKLEAKGYVSVDTPPEDRRQKLVQITDAGRAAHARALKAIGPTLEKIGADFGVERLAALLPDLEALRAYLDEARNERDGL